MNQSTKSSLKFGGLFSSSLLINFVFSKCHHDILICLTFSQLTVVRLTLHIANFFLGEDNLNAGLNFLWDEERARREALKKSGAIEEMSAEMPTVDDLLPLTG